MCVLSMWMPGLDPEKHLGKSLADMEPYLKKVLSFKISFEISVHAQSRIWS